MRAKFKVLSGERLCEKAFGADLGEFDSSKSAFVGDESHKNAFACEFDSHENAVASQKGALMSAFKTHLSELKRAFASLCERTKFKNERVKKNFGVGISLSLSLSLVSASTLCAECA